MFSQNNEYFEYMYLGITNCVRSGIISRPPDIERGSNAEAQMAQHRKEKYPGKKQHVHVPKRDTQPHLAPVLFALMNKKDGT